MDVRLVRLVLFCISLVFIASCGNRYDLDKEYGRRARIDDANMFISAGECASAIQAIAPVFNSPNNDEEVTIVMASAYACAGGFRMLNLAANLGSIASPFGAVAASMPNNLNDNRLASMYLAVDILSGGNTNLNSWNRSKNINSYMVFLQLGLMGAILNGYGSPMSTAGTQVSNLVYSNPRNAGEMTNIDSCALTAALSSVSDSYSNSNLNDSTTSNAIASLDSACANAGIGVTTCAALNRNRTLCTGLVADVPSVRASAIVTAVNNAW
jgi:hypothetical protein